jgi:hypothetical protein
MHKTIPVHTTTTVTLYKRFHFTFRHEKTIWIFLLKLLTCCSAFLFQSCAAERTVAIRNHPVTGTVRVYHFIVSGNKRKPADTTHTNSFIRESKIAYDWISHEAANNGVNLYFKEFWPDNKDSLMRKTFGYKLPNTNLKQLTRIHKVNMVIQKRTKDHPQIVAPVDWSNALFDSLAAHVKDSAVAEMLHRASSKSGAEEDPLIVIHVLKVKKSWIQGFQRPRKGIYIGDNTSLTIAHESIHYLGAPDLYIHRFWFGKKSHTVKVKLWDEVMNFGIPTTRDCRLHVISNYTAYTMGWTKTIDKKYKPLLKRGFMARLVYTLFMLL